MKLNRLARVYIGLVLATLLVAIGYVGPGGMAQGNLVVAAAWLVLAVLSEIGKVHLQENVYISGTALVAELAVLTLPAPLAASVMFVGGLLGHAVRRRPWSKALFNASLFGLCTWAGAMAFSLSGGHLGMPVTASLLIPYVTMLAVWNLANVLVLGGLFSTLQHHSPFAFWISIEKSVFYNQIVFGVVGLFMEAIYFQMHLLGLLFIFVMLVAVRMAFQLYADNRNFYQEITEVLGRALAFKDPLTGSHSQRVADLAAQIGREMGIVDRELDLLRHAALVHDVGKVAIPDAILNKPGPLDPTERVTMDTHVTAADDILEHSRHLGDVAQMVRGHHERLDGTGYPKQLGVGEIPLTARIIAVADAYDAMTQDRPYRRALPNDEVVLRLVQGSGTQFDPGVLRALFRLKGIAEAIEAGATAGALPPPDAIAEPATIDDPLPAPPAAPSLPPPRSRNGRARRPPSGGNIAG